MSTGLIDVIKRASMDAMDAAQTADLRYGTVTSVSPLKVQVTNQFTIPESMLVVPKTLTDYTIKVTMDWTTSTQPNHTHSYSTTSDEANLHTHGVSGTTEGAGGHSHSLVSTGDKTIKIHNALKVGDKVALLRQQGGQTYFILDRI